MKIFLLLILASGACGIFITCNFRNTQRPVLGLVYTCVVSFVDFSDNSTHLTGYNGTHLSGNSSSDVVVIWFSTCFNFNLTTVPKGFLNFFPNFIGFYFYACPISLLNGDELEEYPNLEWYAHYNSTLTRIPGNFFAPTQKMMFVNFRYNQIQHVGENFLSNLEKLRQLAFEGNICINSGASSSAIPAFIEKLIENCPDIEPETTTTPPRCEIYDFEDFVCDLDEEIEILKLSIENLKTSNENLQNEVKEVSSRNDELKANVQNLESEIEIFEENVKNLIQQNQETRENLESHSEILLQLEAKVIELYSRPCSC